MKSRTRQFALRCIRLVASFPKGPVGDTVARQLVKSSTSVAANYRAACAGRSHADFLNKLGIVEEEADESIFWIDLAPEANLTERDLIADLLTEAKEICAIVVASQKTAKARRRATKKRNSPRKS